MTEATAKLNVGYFFTAFNYRWQVTKIGTFSGVVHYGFVPVPITEGSHKGLINENVPCGWIPAEFIGQCELTA